MLVALCGSEQWSLTLRDEHRLSVFENRVLRKIFGPMRDEVTGDWRRLHNTNLHDLYSSSHMYVKKPNMIMGACGMYGREKRCIQGFGGET